MAGATAPLLGLEKKSLREQALSALRTAITSGELEPGRHLVETELSEMLQISRGTLREALRQLEQEGLLSAGPRGRLSVRHLDAKEIRDIFSVRAALESLAARTLCELPDRQHVITLAARRHRRHGRGHRRQPRGADRIRPGVPPHPVPPHRQRDPAALLGIAGGFHPDVHHVRRPGQGREEHERGPAPRHRRRHRDRRRTLARNTIREHMDTAAANLVAKPAWPSGSPGNRDRVSSPRSRRRRY